MQWRADAPYTLDVTDVERALAQAADRAGDQATMRAALMDAAERYRGDLLPGWYDNWVLLERERLARRSWWRWSSWFCCWKRSYRASN